MAMLNPLSEIIRIKRVVLSGRDESLANLGLRAGPWKFAIRDRGMLHAG
jgi:hypothetical protein